jgi:uncharacterized membrane protein YkvA (DUF1232 family)
MTETLPTRYDPEKLKRDEARVSRGFWAKLKRVARRLPFLEELVAAYFCAIDPKTPLQVKAVLMAALAYFVLPADLVPDFLAWFGFGDDAAVLYAAVKTVAGSIKPDHRARARELIERQLAPSTPAS